MQLFIILILIQIVYEVNQQKIQMLLQKIKGAKQYSISDQQKDILLPQFNSNYSFIIQIYKKYFENNSISNSMNKSYQENLQKITFNLKILSCLNQYQCQTINQQQIQNFNQINKIDAGQDLLIAVKDSIYVMHCNQLWQKIINCGSFIQIHRPFNQTIIEQLKINDYEITDWTLKYISTRSLCAGNYHIWYVLRTRVGNFIRYVKQIYFKTPSCNNAK